MTETTDIAALREHNQHIVAHLTRSNPRRPLSSAEVLTLESAKLVVAALSVRDGLPDADHSEYWFEHEGKLLFDGALFNSRVEIFIESKLEAERQRADDAHKYGSERDSENESLMLTVGRLRVEIAELKGDQKPYGYYSAETETILEQQGHASISAEPLADSRFPLFTAPQKPVVTLPALPTTPIVPTQPFSLHDIMRATRNMDIKAIEAAGGIVSTSDQRLMQDMSGIVQDGE